MRLSITAKEELREKSSITCLHVYTYIKVFKIKHNETNMDDFESNQVIIIDNDFIRGVSLICHQNGKMFGELQWTGQLTTQGSCTAWEKMTSGSWALPQREI